MKKTLSILLLGIIVLKGFSQGVNKKYLIGASFNYSHDDLRNNSLLSNYNKANQNFSNTFEFSGELGYFLKSGNLLGLEIGFVSNSSTQERIIISEQYQIKDYLNSKSSGIIINPKYSFIKRVSDKIWLYNDINVELQYFNHKNNIPMLDQSTYELDNLNMNGTEFKYGLAINPGIIFNIYKSVGIKLDYSLFNVIHSSLKETDDNEINFDKINSWDYEFNMKLTGFKLGIVFTL